MSLDEPFHGLFTQGMVTHETYKDENGKWLFRKRSRCATERPYIAQLAHR